MERELIFFDDFIGGKINPEFWNYEVGNHQWPNNEKQAYTNRENNIYLKDSCLHIVSRKEKDGEREYTSSKINTRGKKYFKYGYFEIRAKLPMSHGAWSAFWLMPNERKEGEFWPDCGEIDMMEFIPHHKYNPDKGVLLYSLHSKNHNHRNKNCVQYTIFNNNYLDLDKEFHLYGMEWNENEFIYYFDNKEVARFKVSDDKECQNEDSWPFHKDFYLIINVAVGGGLGGAIYDEELPCSFIVDYVKVYK